MSWLPVLLGLGPAIWMTLLSKYWAPKSLQTVTAAMKLKDSPWKESYDKCRQHIKKQRHHFANKGLYSKSYGFSNRHVRMWELDHKEGWEPKNWCFHLLKEFRCWVRFLKVPWTARSNQSILKKINPEYSLEGLMLKLKLQYFDHLIRGANSMEKTLMMLGKTEGRRRGWLKMSWLDGNTNSVDMNLSKLWEIVKDMGAWHAVVHGCKIWTRLRNWTTTGNI